MKIFHFADIHARDKDIDEVEKCLNFIVSVAKEEQPDLLVNAGDTFDAAGIRADSLSAKLIFKIFKELADIAPMAIVLGTPGHDSTTASILRYTKARFPIYVSTKPEQIYLMQDGSFVTDQDITLPMLTISQLPTPTKQFWVSNSSVGDTDAEIGNALSGILAGFGAQADQYSCPHILTLHGTIRGAKLSEGQTIIGRDIEIGEDQIGLANATLVCCGHLHYHQILKNNIIYSGSIYANNYGEIEDKGFYIHTISEKS